MTDEEKRIILRTIRCTHDYLQDIMQGQDPYRLETTFDLRWMRDFSSWRLNSLLKDLVPFLPEEVRASVQMCLDLYKYICSSEYSKAYYAKRKKASPPSANVRDSL
jgi:hypothetical protein